ncbi:MAG: hypothetical protein JSV24_06050 [Bacteroidales bacterium]|nr:MAG: hypothetical protein JSV24_06050 [Bacteroidales bacterium]
MRNTIGNILLAIGLAGLFTGLIIPAKGDNSLIIWAYILKSGLIIGGMLLRNDRSDKKLQS